MRKSFLAGALLIASIGFTQPVVLERRMGGYATGSPYNLLYNQKSQITFDGVVTGIQRVNPMPGMDVGVTLLVKNDDGGGTAVVELGPAWFVDRQMLQIKVKDRVSVTGSKVMIDGRGVILAKLVQVDTDVLALRRPNGVPYWDVGTPVVNAGPYPGLQNLTGQIEEYRVYRADGSMYSGLVLNTPGGTVQVDLGPQWFIGPQGFVFPVGSTISIGTPNLRVPYNGSLPVYWFQMNGNTIQLRNSNGIGIWQGWRP